MFQRILVTTLLVVFATASVGADRPSFLKMFRPAPKVEAKESKMYRLTEVDGPWLILASYLVGEDSERRAQRLAVEIRRELGLPAYIYKENFDFTGQIEGRSRKGNSASLRYANRYQYDAYAVLVGEYDRVDHPRVEGDLQRVKTAVLPIFEDPDEVHAENNRSNPVTTVKSITRKILQSRKDKPLGPMGHAFVTRNPMLPEEYFQAPEVDSFVHQLNDGKEYSLLKCKGRYTVVVKTFEGQRTIVNGEVEKEFTPNGDRMDRFAEDAARMTRALRAKGVEAYQFHDRFRSIVTVGSFDELGRELPNGFEYTPEIRAVRRQYSAYNVDPALARQVPKGARGVAANNIAMIPFDVEPKPIAVPRPTRRSIYRAVGMN